MKFAEFHAGQWLEAGPRGVSGDKLTPRAEVLDRRRGASKPGLGILGWRWHLHNRDGAIVLDPVATGFSDLATGQST